MSEVLLDPAAIALALRRLAAEVASRSGTGALAAGPLAAAPLRLVAIRRGGEHASRVLAREIGELVGEAPLRGAVDITLYRDDAATALPNLRVGPSHLPFEVAGARVVLVDDVISSGRTVRAAIDAVLDYGRPLKIELAVLVDRGGRELPIQPDYVGLTTNVGAGKRVEVVMKKKGPDPEEDEPWALVVPSPPPAPAPSRRGGRGPGPGGTTS